MRRNDLPSFFPTIAVLMVSNVLAGEANKFLLYLGVNEIVQPFIPIWKIQETMVILSLLALIFSLLSKNLNFQEMLKGSVICYTGIAVLITSFLLWYKVSFNKTLVGIEIALLLVISLLISYRVKKLESILEF